MNIRQAYIETKSAKKIQMRSEWKNYIVIENCDVTLRTNANWDVLQLIAGNKYLLITNTKRFTDDIWIGLDYGYNQMRGTIALFDNLTDLKRAFNTTDISGREPVADRTDYYFFYTKVNPWGSPSTQWDTTRNYWSSGNYTIQIPSGSYTYSQRLLEGMFPAT